MTGCLAGQMLISIGHNRSIHQFLEPLCDKCCSFGTVATISRLESTQINSNAPILRNLFRGPWWFVCIENGHTHPVMRDDAIGKH